MLTPTSKTRTTRPLANHRFVEPLEHRQLLAADVGAAVTADAALTPTTDPAVDAPLATGSVDGTDVASFYAGRLKFARADDQPRRIRRDAVINVANAQENGSFSGTISSAGIGDVTFNGQMTGGRQFTADITGDLTGTLYGEIRRRGNRFVASIVPTSGGEIGIQARAATPTGQTVVLPADGVVGDELTAGTVAYTGLAAGRNAFSSRVDDPALANPDFTPGRLRNDVALEITDQTSTGLVGGRLTVGDRVVPVNGVVNDGRLTLLVLPEAGTVEDAAVGTGVLRLNLNPFGTGYAGSYSNASEGVLEFGRLSLTRAEPISALSTNTFGSLGGLAAALEAGSFRGDPLSTPTTLIGTPATTGTEVGTAIDIGTTPISPVTSGTEIGTPGSTGTEIGSAVYVGAPTTTAPRSFGSAAPTTTGTLLDRTYSGNVSLLG